MKNTSPKAFVIMPFNEEFKSIYDDLIMAPLKDTGYDVARADSLLDQQNILGGIVRGIATADLIVADLTTLNSNVLYELGLCHGLNIPTILITQALEDVPFDLRGYKILIYSTRYDQVHKLKLALKEIGEKHKIQAITFDSPITDFLPNRAREPREQLERKENEQLEEEKGSLDLRVESDKAIAEIADIISVFNKETADINTKIVNHTALIQDLNKKPELGTAAQVHKLLAIAATDMTSYAEKVEGHIPRLEKSIDIMADNFRVYLPSITSASKEAVEFREIFAGLLKNTKAALGSIRFFRDSVSSLRGITKELNSASRRLHQTLEGVINAFGKLEAFCARTLPLIDERLEPGN